MPLHKLLIFLSLSASILLQCHSNSQHSIQYCQTPLGDVGTCVSLQHCPEVLSFFSQLGAQKAKDYSMVLQRLCGNRITPDQYPVLCCTHPVLATTPAPDEPTTKPSIVTSTTSTASPDTLDKNIKTPDVICVTPSFQPGVCKALINCPEQLELLIANPHSEDIKKSLRQLHTECGNRDTVICCPSAVEKKVEKPPSPTGVHRLPSEEEGCGWVNVTTPKVVGGEESQIGAWPWMALIGYNRYSARPFRCGGSLITARHVLTAAHCLRHDLSFVRLGEFDLATETETRHLDVDVIKHVPHPQYGKDRRSDLAVLLLETSVQFTDLIAPICLPLSRELRSKSYVDAMAYVAGFGNTQEGGKASNVLKQAQLPVQEVEVCRNIYAKLMPWISADNFNEAIICAGYMTGGDDTCQGDSGGPLMIAELYKGVTRYYLIGIVSYGRGCGRVPAVYMSTQYRMDWIAQQIETM